MGTKHKHAEIIKAWADGAVIQFAVEEGEKWIDYSKSENPSWDNNLIYRIKPEPKPDIVWYTVVDREKFSGEYKSLRYGIDNLKLVFDGETGTLKSAKVLK